MENTSIRMGGLLVFKSPVIMARYEMQLIEAERGYQLQARKKTRFYFVTKTNFEQFEVLSIIFHWLI